jgi:hypothetical protein
VQLLPVHLGSQAGVFVLLLAPVYFAPLRRFAAAYHQRQEALAAAEILAPLSRRAAADVQPGAAAARGHGTATATAPGTAGRTPAPASVPRRASCCTASRSASRAAGGPRSPL